MEQPHHINAYQVLEKLIASPEDMESSQAWIKFLAANTQGVPGLGGFVLNEEKSRANLLYRADYFQNVQSRDGMWLGDGFSSVWVRQDGTHEVEPHLWP